MPRLNRKRAGEMKRRNRLCGRDKMRKQGEKQVGMVRGLSADVAVKKRAVPWHEYSPCPRHLMDGLAERRLRARWSQ
jgi:hypothetical protein